jgi:hypothetical protein
MIPERVHRSVRLACGPARAFALFTQRISLWWPPSRRHTSDPDSQIYLQAAGRFFERAADGHEVELGRVTLWDPPARLELDFYPGTDPDHPTKLVVTFTAAGVETEVTILHTPTAASAELWANRVPRFEANWDLVLAGLSGASLSW